MVTLIVNGEVYGPKPKGTADVLILGGKIARIGRVDRAAVEGLGVEVNIIDASGCVVTPGFFDPHEHLHGGGGEEGFSSQTPEIRLEEIVTAGVTSVVGCLGVDITTKTMAGLLARAKALKEQGISAFVWSGGYPVPGESLLKSTRDDIIFIEEIIGAGEIAISDERAVEPDAHDLARLVIDVHVGGLLNRKGGVTHFHVGDGKKRLESIRKLLSETEVKPDWLYLTHIGRNEAVMKEAIDLAGKGVFVDIDVVEEDLAKWLRFYFDNDGDPAQLTVSSDASLSSPGTLYEQLRGCIVEHGFSLEQVLPLVTTNTARVLKLDAKGTLDDGKDADVLVLRKDSLEIVEVIARGQRLLAEGRLNVEDPFHNRSKRKTIS